MAYISKKSFSMSNEIAGLSYTHADDINALVTILKCSKINLIIAVILHDWFNVHNVNCAYHSDLVGYLTIYLTCDTFFLFFFINYEHMRHVLNRK